MPTSKVTFGASAGAIVTIVVWLLGQFHITIPPEISAAVVTIVSFATGYVKTETTTS